MKFLIIIVKSVLIFSVKSRHLRLIKLSTMYDYITIKKSSVTNYVVNKARYLKDVTVCLLPSFKEIVQNYIEDKTSEVKTKVAHYIKKAQKTASTIYHNIVQESFNYECKEEHSEIYMNTPELITVNGYVAESHEIVTDDGYLLTVHRIPHSKNSTSENTKVALLHHGLLACSADWVLSRPEKSLGFILSDAGYDVWLANARGNVYSRGHISKNIDTYEFWNFSFHEIGYYDLSAVIDYILLKKGDVKINFVGFSMGTTALFTLLSTRLEYNNKLNGAIALSPVAFMTDTKSPFKLVSKFGDHIKRFSKLVGVNEFLASNALIRYFAKHSSTVAHFKDALCELSMFFMCGHDKGHFDYSLMPKILRHVPAGASTKTLAHFSQELNNGGRFQQYDYGKKGNMKRYGIETAPEYPLYKITLPIYLMSAKDNWISSITDAVKLSLELSNVKKHCILKDETFNHLDFLFAKDVRNLVYDEVLRMLDELNS